MRRLAVLGLVAYALVLALAAVPAEVRPHALDGPSRIAWRSLRAVGIQPGLAVFETGYGEHEGVMVLADCIRVVARDADGRSTVLAPPGDHCVTSGSRLVVPWEEGALRAVVLRAPPGVAEPAIGAWACRGPHWGSSAWREVTVTWTQPWKNLRSGEQGVTNAAYFVWRCEPPDLVRRVLRPTDAELRSLEASAP